MGEKWPVRAKGDTGQSQALGLPKYKRLERKELLIWPDQITELFIRARSLNRVARTAGTANG
jgi:hypothetical protein